jgi:hypothetical protein
VDQGCYQEAVAVLEAGQQDHPHNSELAGKLRDVRSLVTEQTYIEGLTQAAEGAKFQRNQLRCTRLADITACDEALKFKPDDPQLLLAKQDALKSKQAEVEAQQASTAAPPATVAATSAGQSSPKRATGTAPMADTTAANKRPRAGSRGAAPAEAPVASVASIEPASTRTYSNEAPPGQSN